MDFEGKVVWVTSGAVGIGKTMTTRFKKAGATVTNCCGHIGELLCMPLIYYRAGHD